MFPRLLFFSPSQSISPFSFLFFSLFLFFSFSHFLFFSSRSLLLCPSSSPLLAFSFFITSLLDRSLLTSLTKVKYTVWPCVPEQKDSRIWFFPVSSSSIFYFVSFCLILFYLFLSYPIFLAFFSSCFISTALYMYHSLSNFSCHVILYQINLLQADRTTQQSWLAARPVPYSQN